MSKEAKWGGKRKNQDGRPPVLVGRKPKQVIFDKKSLAAVQRWRKKYGVPSDSEAVREMLSRAIQVGREID